MIDNVIRQRTVEKGVKAAFMTILSRPPDDDESKIAIQEVRQSGAAGYGNVIWSLVNTREFLFIQ